MLCPMMKLLRKLCYSYLLPIVYTLVALFLVAFTVDYIQPYELAAGTASLNERPVIFQVKRKSVNLLAPNYRVRASITYGDSTSPDSLIYEQFGGRYSTGDIIVFMSESSSRLMLQDKFRCCVYDLNDLEAPQYYEGRKCSAPHLIEVGRFTENRDGSWGFKSKA